MNGHRQPKASPPLEHDPLGRESSHASGLRPRVRPGPFAQLRRENSDLRQENARLRQALAELEAFRDLALRDPLTGLGNRRAFDERLAEETARALRGGPAFSVLVLDLDGFKGVNDAQGHAGGDAVLRAASALFQGAIRRQDTAYRIGGDEMAVLLPATNLPGALHVADRIQSRVRAALVDGRLPIGVSIGAAVWSEACATPDAVFESADAAMYADKVSRRVRSPR